MVAADADWPDEPVNMLENKIILGSGVPRSICCAKKRIGKSRPPQGNGVTLSLINFHKIVTALSYISGHSWNQSLL